MKSLNSYAGIGARNTPHEYLEEMKLLSKFLNDNNFLLRSGGSTGADEAFESNSTNSEIFIPWKGFNGMNNGKLPNPTMFDKADELLKLVHHGFHDLHESSLLLHRRNVSIILGSDLNDPVDFVICYTSDGLSKGGTGVGMKIAEMMTIPVINIFHKQWKNEFNEILSNLNIKYDLSK